MSQILVVTPYESNFIIVTCSESDLSHKNILDIFRVFYDVMK